MKFPFRSRRPSSKKSPQRRVWFSPPRPRFPPAERWHLSLPHPTLPQPPARPRAWFKRIENFDGQVPSDCLGGCARILVRGPGCYSHRCSATASWPRACLFPPALSTLPSRTYSSASSRFLPPGARPPPHRRQASPAGACRKAAAAATAAPPLSQTAPSRRGGRACDPPPCWKRARARASAQLPGPSLSRSRLALFPPPAPGSCTGRCEIRRLPRAVISNVPLPRSRGKGEAELWEGAPSPLLLPRQFQPQLAQSFDPPTPAEERLERS